RGLGSIFFALSCLTLLNCGGSGEPGASPSPSPSATPTPTASPDFDLDGVANETDNCLEVVNPSQGDGDGNGTGDACDLPLAEFYEPAVPGSLKIFQLDQVDLPTRLKISPDGSLLFVAELGGKVQVYNRVNDTWVRQTNPFLEVSLGGLDVSEERGMTGLFLGVDFDPHSPDPLRRDLFVTYQFLDGGDFVNRIARVTVNRSGENWTAGGFLVIYEGPDPINSASSIGAHQIQDGLSLSYGGLPHLLVAIGDGFFPASATDESKESLGKILLMQRDGSPAAGDRPFANEFIQAKGIRNVYSMALLPEELDPRRRVLAVENGAGFQDRIWLLELIDFGHETDLGINLGWNGDDSSAAWEFISDFNTPGPFDTEGVLRLLDPPVSPTGLALHPGRGIVSAPPNQAAFVAAYFGPTFCTGDDCPGKEIVAGSLGNFGNQPTIDSLTTIVRRSAAGQEKLGNPTALAVDPLSGDILFADIVTGEIDRIVVFP
ncbi:MAG TPA: PQQ-dependent sugar dehydrogenase, partial [bacterium]|nr:PQQ-dependent sugar dehydrogenase [bacterium]